MCRDFWSQHASHRGEYERKVGVINLNAKSGIQQWRCLCVGSAKNSKEERGGLGRRGFPGMQRMMVLMGTGVPTRITSLRRPQAPRSASA